MVGWSPYAQIEKLVLVYHLFFSEPVTKFSHPAVEAPHSESLGFVMLVICGSPLFILMFIDGLDLCLAILIKLKSSQH